VHKICAAFFHLHYAAQRFDIKHPDAAEAARPRMVREK
jgi:hypothetical protein